VKVLGSNVTLNGVEGWYRSVGGAENTLTEESYTAASRATTGPESLEITTVAVRVVEPEKSMAVSPIVTPVTVFPPTSPGDGVP
jgi:hypothetical protein